MAWTNPTTRATGDLITASIWNTDLVNNLKAVAAVGDYKYTCQNRTATETVVDGGWLECNGVAVSRTTYADLFALLNGLTPALPFGTGNGTTTFNLPDLQGRMVVHEGTHADVTLGDSDGGAVGDRRPKHKHTTNQTAGIAENTAPDTRYMNTGEQAGTFITLTVGPQSNVPTDAPAHLVAGIWAIKF